MNKQNLWFLTLFSFVLILGVYYITLPSEIFKSDNSDVVSKEIDVVVSEENKLLALRVQRDEEVSTVMSELQDKINCSTCTSEEKNNAFEELQVLNLSKGKEMFLEEKIQKKFNINSYVEINNDNINVIISSVEHNVSIANDVMRSIQEEFEDKKVITIKFE